MGGKSQCLTVVQLSANERKKQAFVHEMDRMEWENSQMVRFIVTGGVLGMLLAFMATGSKRNFRKSLLEELLAHQKAGTVADHVARITVSKDQWLKSLSSIKKPFRKEVNLVVETAAVLLGLTGIINSFSNFDKYFSSALQGEVALCVLSLVVAFIPCEWFLLARIEPQVDAVFEELTQATKSGRLDRYIVTAKECWK